MVIAPARPITATGHMRSRRAFAFDLFVLRAAERDAAISAGMVYLTIATPICTKILQKY
jgi:hypothetical protein